MGGKGFDPGFDDTAWTDGWLSLPLALIPPGIHPSGYRIERCVLEHAEVFGRPIQLAAPLECRLLFDPEGRMWMSDTPQERIMMYNNGRLSWGSALVGGLGLGLYLQYAASGMAGKVTRFTVIERSPVVVDVVRPTLDVSLGVPLQIRIGDVATYLSKPSNMRYDTIFLDTWDTLDAAHLPAINRLRDLALRRLAPGGQVLLWGYRWMVRLFEEACRQLLAVTPGQRRAWLTARAEASPKGVALLTPVLDYVDEQAEKDAQSVLDWCRQYIVQRVVQV